jgi:DNA-binding NtrC family response regulator
MENPFESHPRIFIVDDEISIAKMLCVILQMHLFDTVPFDNPQMALEAARAEPPDYLISDIAMQGMTGIELAILVEREVPACKVLLFSGQVDAPEMIRQAREAGHTFSFLQKPLHPTELVAALRKL